jgi:hypothetical protein
VFEALVSKAGTRHVIVLPFEPDEVWGKRARHHITGSVGGRKIRGALVRDADSAVLVLPPSWRRDNPLADGPVQVDLSPEGPQVDALAPDILAALQASPPASEFFQSLAQFYRKAYLAWLDGASRRPELRRQRLAEFVALLEAGKKSRKD